MAKVNMVKVSTLIRKGYLLAGVIMAANMFVVNDVKAMNENDKLNQLNQQGQFTTENTNNNKEKEEDKKGKISGVQNILNKVLSWENTINLIGGAAFSVANNYFKWWDYNPGGYFKLGCLGWRSGRHIKDIFQIGINLNLGRGVLWLIPGVFGFMQYREEKIERPIILNSTAGLITMKILYTNEDDFKKNNSGFGFGVSYFIFVILQGFISAPLTFHISNFSISISLDSILWAGIGYFLDNGKKKEANKDEEEKLFDISQSQQDLNAKNDNYNN